MLACSFLRSQAKKRGITPINWKPKKMITDAANAAKDLGESAHVLARQARQSGGKQVRSRQIQL